MVLPDWIPALDAPLIHPDAPRFSARRYDMRNNAILGIGTDGQVISESMFPGEEPRWLTIYVFSAQSRYAEDHEYERNCFATGMLQGYCFSTVAPEGEVGLCPLSDLEPISEEEFLAAAARGWQP